MTTTHRYYAAAVILSALWIPVLSFHSGLPRATAWMPMLCFVLAGVITACLYRRLIVEAEGLANILYGATLPFFAAEIFAMISVVAGFVASIVPGSHVDPFYGILSIFFVPLAALKAAYVVVPFGILVQYLMRWAGREPAR